MPSAPLAAQILAGVSSLCESNSIADYGFRQMRIL